MTVRFIFWTLAAVAVVAPFASCYGAGAGVRRALGTHEEWVYEECVDVNDRQTRCYELEEPRKQTTTTAGADIYAGWGAFIVAVWIGVATLSFLNKRWRVTDVLPPETQ